MRVHACSSPLCSLAHHTMSQSESLLSTLSTTNVRLACFITDDGQNMVPPNSPTTPLLSQHICTHTQPQFRHRSHVHHCNELVEHAGEPKLRERRLQRARHGSLGQEDVIQVEKRDTAYERQLRRASETDGVA